VRPRSAPKEGIRKLPVPAPLSAAPSGTTPETSATPQGDPEHSAPAAPIAPAGPVLALVVEGDRPPASAGWGTADPVARPAACHAVEITPVSADRYSLRATIDAAVKEDLEMLAALLSHKIPNGDLAAVLREAIRCGIEKHGKRRGAVAPTRRRAKALEKAAPFDPRAISAETRRGVWKRDGGRCTFVSADGHRCESRWRLELDHVRSPHHGGTANADDLRLRCRTHNLLYAEQVFGHEHMSQFCRTAEGPR
jgi:hypothetical protein